MQLIEYNILYQIINTMNQSSLKAQNLFSLFQCFTSIVWKQIKQKLSVLLGNAQMFLIHY